MWITLEYKRGLYLNCLVYFVRSWEGIQNSCYKVKIKRAKHGKNFIKFGSWIMQELLPSLLQNCELFLKIVIIIEVHFLQILIFKYCPENLFNQNRKSKIDVVFLVFFVIKKNLFFFVIKKNEFGIHWAVLICDRKTVTRENYVFVLKMYCQNIWTLTKPSTNLTF